MQTVKALKQARRHGWHGRFPGDTIAVAHSMEVEAPGKDFTSVIEKGAEQEKVQVQVIDAVDVKVINQDSEADCKKGGALASGEEIDIWTFRNIGFILQYFAVGLIYGGLPATVYGFFLGYLNVPGYIYATASVVTTLPWSFKVAFGLLNDCLPIRGYRRKPYMVLGWSICFVVLVILSWKPLPEPYYCLLPDGGFDEDKVCNEEAQMQGGSFALLMCLAALGYVIADVAADGLMVEFAQREPEEKRGTIQTTIYLVRTLGMVFAVALVGIGMNGKEYQGTFDFSLTYSQVMLIFSLPAGAMVPISWFLVQDSPIQPGERKSFKMYCSQAWALITNKAIFIVIMYDFWEALIGRISTTAGGLVKSQWAGVKNFQNQLFTLVSLLVFAYSLHLVKKHFLNFSWRKMLLITGIILNLFDATLALCTTYDVVRNQYFYLGETILDEIPAAANFVVGTFIIVEMADQGNEGLTYGLFTTVSNLGFPFSRAIGNQIFGLFQPNLSDRENYKLDTMEFRHTVARSFLLSYAFSFASFLLLVLLPYQKQEAQRRKREWSRRPAFGYITCGLLLLAFIYSMTVNFLTMIPETACLKLIGGSGC